MVLFQRGFWPRFRGISGLVSEGLLALFQGDFWPCFRGFFDLVPEGFLALFQRVFWPDFQRVSGLISEGLLERVFWPDSRGKGKGKKDNLIWCLNPTLKGKGPWSRPLSH